MKHLEAFTMGKKFGQPYANEDSFVIIPGQGYAVIDGVTDRNGTRYGGTLSGQFASRTIKRAVEQFIIAQTDPHAPSHLAYSGPENFVEYLTASLRQGYIDEGALDVAAADWKVRAGCTVMAAIIIGDRLEVVAVGDTGIRINGDDVLQVLKPIDDITGILRREAWGYFAGLGRDADYCNTQSAAVTWLGTSNQVPGTPTSDTNVIAEIKARAVAACQAQLPAVPNDELLEIVEHGIIHGQGNFKNFPDRFLGYGCLDGFPVNPRHIEARSYALSEIETVELFSDGYFKIPDGFGVAAWEEAFDEVERLDPHKIGPYPSAKGTTAAALTDDRTYVGIRLR
jgi:hypothetical protein